MIVVCRTTIDFICISVAFQKLEILEKCSNNTIVVYRTIIDFICVSVASKNLRFFAIFESFEATETQM